MAKISTFPEPNMAKDSLASNQFGLSPELYSAVMKSVSRATISGNVDLTDGANISTDASQGSDFHVTLGGNRTINAPSNPVGGQVIRYWVTQDGTGSRTLTWDAVFRFSTLLPAPTLTTTADFMDMIEFRYHHSYGTWDCIRIVTGYDATPL